MAGILDKKTRIMDFVLTDEGRRQIRDGGLRASFASFTDAGAFYEEESNGVASNANSRIYFEPSSRYQDKIIVESNRGSMYDFSIASSSGSYDLRGYQVSFVTESQGTGVRVSLSGSSAFDASDEIFSGITQNFTDNQLIGTEDVFSYRLGFDISSNNITFNANNSSPIDTWNYIAQDDSFRPPTLASFDATVFDRRFAHFPNYKFLPPINKIGAGTQSGRPLGEYAKLNQPEILTYDRLKQELKGKESYEIKLDPTSRDNNILIQPFEFGSDAGGTVRKLTIIDYGVFPNDKGTSAGVHVFFLGKLLKSNDGSMKYFNIFTLELDV
jgi:hypothetical protein